MLKLRTLALSTVTAAAPLAASAAPSGIDSPAAYVMAMNALPYLFVGLVLFIPGLQLLLGLLRGNRPAFVGAAARKALPARKPQPAMTEAELLEA